MSTLPASSALERAFPTFDRGVNREDILRSYRYALRKLTNPDTGLPFSEADIAAAVSSQSRWYVEADAIDLVLLAGQNRALWLADQVRLDRASFGWLQTYHGGLWGETPLPATGGSGTATGSAVAFTPFVGSTVIPDAAAVQATDPAGKKYQVLFSTAATAGGTVTLTFKGVDTGPDTNPAPGTVLTYSQNKPLGAQPTCTVATQFTGGALAETSAEFAARIAARIRHKPASGNNAHFRSWATVASVAVEDAFVYACALHAGTVLVAATQKRGSIAGPAARVPSIGTLTDLTAYLVPPASPVVPAVPLVVVVPVVQQPADMVLSLSMPLGTTSGWTDPDPWPTQAGGVATLISAVTTQTQFRITTSGGGLPSGITAPSLMAWDEAASAWETLDVQSVTLFAPGVYDVVLNSAPTMTLVGGQAISPDAGRADTISDAITAYFDSLGPGEVVDLTTDSRAHRAFRYPQPTEEYPQRAGSSVTNYLHDALKSTLADSVLEACTAGTPVVPASPLSGPALVVAGVVGIYPL